MVSAKSHWPGWAAWPGWQHIGVLRLLKEADDQMIASPVPAIGHSLAPFALGTGYLETSSET